MTPCEAERRILMALYEIELMWGSGRVDLTQIRATLTGTRDTQPCAHQTTESVPITIKIGT